MKFSLGFILALSLAGLQLLAIVIVVSTSYLTSEKAMLQHARDRLAEAGVNASEHSNGFLKPARESAELLMRVLENRIISIDDVDQLENFLFQSLNNDTEISGVYFGDEDGNFTYVMRSEGPGPYRTKIMRPQSDDPGAQLIWRAPDYAVLERKQDPTDTYDPRKRPWYEMAMHAASAIWTEPYIFFSSRQPGITFAVPIVIDDTLKGVVGVDIELSTISNFLSQLALSEHASALILDENGNVIAHANMSEIIEGRTSQALGFVAIKEIGDPVTQAAFAGLGSSDALENAQEIQFEFEYQRDKYVSLLKPLSGVELPWFMAVYAPENDFTQSIKDLSLIHI